MSDISIRDIYASLDAEEFQKFLIGVLVAILSGVQAKPRPWWVVQVGGSDPLMRYEIEGAAELSCRDRNDRAKNYDIECRYEVVFRDEETA